MSKKKISKKMSVQKAKSSPKSPTPQVTSYPTAGRKVTEFETELDKQLAAGEQTEQKRGPGRPRKDSQTAEPVVDIGPQLQQKVLERMLRIPFSAWAKYAGIEDLALTDHEASDLAAASKELLDYYIPNLPPVLIMWSNFTVTMLCIVQPRFARITEMKKIIKEKQTEKTGQEGRQPAGQGRPISPVKFPSKVETQKL
jgi:hypothetical protein